MPVGYNNTSLFFNLLSLVLSESAMRCCMAILASLASWIGRMASGNSRPRFEKKGHSLANTSLFDSRYHSRYVARMLWPLFLLVEGKRPRRFRSIHFRSLTFSQDEYYRRSQPRRRMLSFAAFLDILEDLWHSSTLLVALPIVRALSTTASARLEIRL